jgi:SagB-type dehydrogenase family enzyme
VLFWRGDRLQVRNYATDTTTWANPFICLLLEYCGEWRSLPEIQRTLGAPGDRLLTRLVQRLVTRTLLERSDRPQSARVRAMSAFDPWNPEAGFFHTGTKDIDFWAPREARRQSKMRAELVPMPRPVKRYRDADVVRLPPRAAADAFAKVLLARRTWRRYSTDSVTLAELSTILALSVGVQMWAKTKDGEVPLKTSPSGGARHPIECYVVARSVAGVKRGLYHYAADRHLLERLRGPVSDRRMHQYLPRSGHFVKASVMVFFTAVFERQLWRYPYSRAYRAALIEAGHVCQTFLLSATSLGLAPYCVMGLADSAIEADLGLDGVTESVLYCAGVGRRPRGSSWAPLTRGRIPVRPNKRLGS